MRENLRWEQRIVGTEVTAFNQIMSRNTCLTRAIFIRSRSTVVKAPCDVARAVVPDQ